MPRRPPEAGCKPRSSELRRIAPIILTALIATGAGPTTRPPEPAVVRPASPQPIRYGRGRLVCTLAHEKIDESSGLAASRKSPGVFWTHNDSGDGAKLYAFSRRGAHLGTFTVQGAHNRDWEDIAMLSVGRKHYLVICDTGDNERRREFATIYLAEEPALDTNRPAGKRKLRVAQTIHFTYEDGPQDTEAVGVDSATRTICLVSKRGKRTVYELPIPGRKVASRVVAKPVAKLDIGQAVAMDISPDGLRAVVLTYGPAYEYARSPKEKWGTAFSRPGRRLPMPGRRQGESISYGPDGKTLYLTSEKLPTPLLEVRAIGGAGGK